LPLFSLRWHYCHYAIDAITPCHAIIIDTPLADIDIYYYFIDTLRHWHY
jgi:hypothetical protein